MLSALKQNKSDWSAGFWLCFIALFLIVCALHGKPVPYNNEFAYLLRLEPNFLPNDWSFSRPANEHWLFNSIFSLPGNFLAIETVGWIGRILSWILCLFAFIRLGKRWDLPYWTIVVSITLWLAFGQSIANNEWIFGTFEAKTIAYACLLFALLKFAEQKVIVPSVLLGLSFSFHPAVGLWAIPAVGLSLLVARIPIKDLAKVIGVTFVFTLPGILPVILDQGVAGSPSVDDWKFVLTKLMPYHFDPFSFSRKEIGVLVMMLIFNVAALWKHKDKGLRFLLNFQIATSLFFAVGVLFRWLELYSLLSYMPMRLFPILTPIFFVFTAFHLAFRLESKLFKALVALFVIAMFWVFSPLEKGIAQVSETVSAWQAQPDDLQRSLKWVAENTPSDAVILAPPRSRTIWYYSRRAQVVAYLYPRYDRLGEWRKRFHDMTGNAEFSDLGNAVAEIDPAYDKLSTEQIDELTRTYSASYLISKTGHPMPVLFSTQTYKVYKLR